MASTEQHDQLIHAVRLALVSGVGPRHRQDLLARFGSPADVLAASSSELQSVSGIGPKIAARIVAATKEIDAEGELALSAEHGIEVLTEASPNYPRPLVQIHDPPGVLFRRGTYLAQDELAIAIVGTRHARVTASRRPSDWRVA